MRPSSSIPGPTLETLYSLCPPLLEETLSVPGPVSDSYVPGPIPDTCVPGPLSDSCVSGPVQDSCVPGPVPDCRVPGLVAASRVPDTRWAFMEARPLVFTTALGSWCQTPILQLRKLCPRMELGLNQGCQLHIQSTFLWARRSHGPRGCGSPAQGDGGRSEGG